MADEDDSTGDAIKADEVDRIQRGTALENSLMGGDRQVAPIDPRSRDPIGKANQQNAAARINRTTSLADQLLNPPAVPQTTTNFTFSNAAARPSMPSPDDLIDGAIKGRRDEIARRQEELRGKIPTIRPNWQGKHDREQIMDEYGALQHADTVLQKDQYERAHIKAGIAAKNFTVERQRVTAEQSTNVLEGISKIQAPLGTPEHAAAVVALVRENPFSLNSAEIKKTLTEHTELHDTAAHLFSSPEEIRKSYPTATIRQDAKTGRYMIENLKADSVDAVPSNILTRYAKLQSDITLHGERAKKEAATNIAKKTPQSANVPYSQSDVWAADAREASLLERAYPQLKEKTATDAPSPSSSPTPTANDVRTQFRAGKITREEATKQLNALGFQ